MAQFISIRDQLISVATVLYSKNPKEANIKILDLPRDYPQRDALCRQISSSSSSTIEKIQAVEGALKSLIEENLPKVPLNQQGAFYDYGFNPDFTFDGTAYQGLTKEFLKKVVELFYRCMFVLRAYFHPHSQERNFRQAVLRCASANAEWSTAAYRSRDEMEKFDFPRGYYYQEIVPLARHDFLEALHTLYQIFWPGSTARLFPSELLNCMDFIHNPQAPEEQEAYARPGWANSDLVRFTNGLQGFDQVPHYLFIYQTSRQRIELKKQLRNVREIVSQCIVDREAAFSVEACKTVLSTALLTFKEAWDNFTNSHPILTAAQRVFSEEDYFASEYRLRRLESWLPFFYLKRRPRIQWNSYLSAREQGLGAVQSGYQRYDLTLKKDLYSSLGPRINFGMI